MVDRHYPDHECHLPPPPPLSRRVFLLFLFSFRPLSCPYDIFPRSLRSATSGLISPSGISGTCVTLMRSAGHRRRGCRDWSVRFLDDREPAYYEAVSPESPLLCGSHLVRHCVHTHTLVSPFRCYIRHTCPHLWLRPATMTATHLLVLLRSCTTCRRVYPTPL